MPKSGIDGGILKRGRTLIESMHPIAQLIVTSGEFTRKMTNPDLAADADSSSGCVYESLQPSI
jgi:hypothetical protein